MRRPSELPILRSTWARWSFAVAAVAILGCEVGGGDPARPNVVLISLDTVRADHTSLYGYPRKTTPALDRLAKRATRYTRARASSSWTLPTHVSMFTGLLPFEHGAHFHPLRGDQAPRRPGVLAASEPTIAVSLQTLGYRTGGFAANVAYLAPRWGFARGFDHYVARHEHATELNQRIFAWLEGTEEPFFLFVNYMDAHTPVNATPRPKAVPGPIVDDSALELMKFRQTVLSGDAPPPANVRRRLIDAYDTGIANDDRGVGELLDWLGHRGWLDRTLVVVTSDHGQFYGAHRLVGHPQGVYEPALRVPLLVKGPGQEEARDDSRLVMSHELPALILGYLRGPDAREQARLFPRQPGAGPDLAELYYETPFVLRNEHYGSRFRRIRRAFYAWPYKLIYSSDGHHELYDLARDPHEQNDLAAREPSRTHALVARVDALIARRGGVRHGVEVRRRTDTQRKQLRALGYVR